MFNLPLSKTLDVGVFHEENGAIHFHAYDGQRFSLKLTRDEALTLIELLVENKKNIIDYLKCQPMNTINVAIVGLDGVVADSSARFARAEEAKLARKKELSGSTSRYVGHECMKAYWSTAFDPSLVELDELIVGTQEALDLLEHKGYHIIFLSSRLRTIEEATTDWLRERGLMDGRELICKPILSQFMKTPVWKSQEVKRIATQAGVASVLFIDDEEGSREAVKNLDLPCISIQDNLIR